MNFRKVVLDFSVPGGLYLHSMPGAHEPFDAALDEILAHAVSCIVCLTPATEVERRSPAYAAAITDKLLPCSWIHFPVEDDRAPTDVQACWILVRAVVDRLRAGENLLVHCRGGIGRSGTFAACVLMALGQTSAQAEATINLAGSWFESQEQRLFVQRFANTSPGCNGA